MVLFLISFLIITAFYLFIFIWSLRELIDTYKYDGKQSEYFAYDLINFKGCLLSLLICIVMCVLICELMFLKA